MCVFHIVSSRGVCVQSQNPGPLATVLAFDLIVRSIRYMCMADIYSSSNHEKHVLCFVTDPCQGWIKTWWRHQMETFSALLAICAGNSPVPGKFPARRALMFPLICALYERMSKQSWGWWFETPSRSSWRQCNDVNKSHEFTMNSLHIFYD